MPDAAPSYKHPVALIDGIREEVAADRFELSKHATDRSIIRRIGMEELRQAAAVGEVIENYPEDKYGPRGLIFGLTAAGRPPHIQCSQPFRSPVGTITLDEPTHDRWIDSRRIHPV